MTELVSGTTPEGPGGAAGGTPAESDLPALQGLAAAADDPSDPEAAGQHPTARPEQRDDGKDAGRSAASDPMPDAAGSGGSS